MSLPRQRPPTVYYRLPDLAARFQVHELTILRWIREKRFPQGVILGHRARRWRSDTIEAFEWSRRQEQLQQSE